MEELMPPPFFSLSSAPLNQAPVPGCRRSSCVLIVHL